MSNKPHNISKLTAEPDPDGVTFTLRVKMNDGGELVINGIQALDTFMEMSCIVANVYIQDEKKKETIH